MGYYSKKRELREDVAKQIFDLLTQLDDGNPIVDEIRKLTFKMI